VNTVSDLSSRATLASTQSVGANVEQLPDTKEAFRDFAAGTLFREMLKAMRQSHDKAAYLHGGQAEDVFREQLDRTISEQLAESHGDKVVGNLYESFEATALSGPRL